MSTGPCHRCNRPLAQDPVAFHGNLYHIGCFRCHRCQAKIREGDQKELDNHPYCESCVDTNPDLYAAFEASVSTVSSSGKSRRRKKKASGGSGASSATSSPGGRKNSKAGKGKGKAKPKGKGGKTKKKKKGGSGNSTPASSTNTSVSESGGWLKRNNSPLPLARAQDMQQTPFWQRKRGAKPSGAETARRRAKLASSKSDDSLKGKGGKRQLRKAKSAPKPKLVPPARGRPKRSRSPSPRPQAKPKPEPDAKAKPKLAKGEGYCSQCNTVGRAGKFCTRCGAKIPKQSRCVIL